MELRQRLSELLGPNLTSSSPASTIMPVSMPSLSAVEESEKQKESASIQQAQVSATTTARAVKEGDNAQKVSQRAFADIDENEENCPPNDAKNC